MDRLASPPVWVLVIAHWGRAPAELEGIVTGLQAMAGVMALEAALGLRVNVRETRDVTGVGYFGPMAALAVRVAQGATQEAATAHGWELEIRELGFDVDDAR